KLSVLSMCMLQALMSTGLISKFCSHAEFASFPCASDAFCQLFFLAMAGHTGPIQIGSVVTPVVCWISGGQAVALLKGRRACRTETGGSLSNRASEGDCGQPKNRDGRCQPKLHRGLGEQLIWFRCHVLLLSHRSDVAVARSKEELRRVL